MDAKTKKQAKDLADEIIREVGPAIRAYVGTKQAGEKVKTGADGILHRSDY